MFDTEWVALQGWRAVGKQLGIQIPEDMLSNMRGGNIPQCRAIFNATVPGERFDEAYALRRAFSVDYINTHGLPVKPGLREILQWLRAENIPAVLATSCDREKALRYVDMAGVSDYFSGAIFGSELEKSKPEPEIFLKAAACVGADPKACVVLEDSPNGLKAAKAAGCIGIMVPDLCPIPEDGTLYTAVVPDLQGAMAYMKNLL